MSQTAQIARPSRLRSIAVNGVVSLATILCGLLIGEFVVRKVRPQELIVPRPELYRPDSTFGWRHVENADTTINTGEGLVRMKIDRRGYRVTSDLPESSDGVRILMLGDSFLEATAVQSEATVSGVLAKELTRLTGRNAFVANTGVGGWDPNHYRLEAKRALAQDKYDLGIVMVYIGNDLMTYSVNAFPARQPSQRHYFRFPRKISKKEMIDTILYPVNDFLETRSHLFQLVKNSMAVPLAQIGLTANYFPPVFQVEDRKSQRWEVTTGILKSIQEEFASRKIPTVFILIPTPYQVDSESFEKYRKGFGIDASAVDLEGPNKILGERMREAGLMGIDPLLAMRARKQSGIDLYGHVDGHLNPAGHQFLAEVLLPEIKRLVHLDEDGNQQRASTVH